MYSFLYDICIYIDFTSLEYVFYEINILHVNTLSNKVMLHIFIYIEIT